MGYFKSGMWHDLKFIAGDPQGVTLGGLIQKIRKNKNDSIGVDYKYQRAYKNVFVFAAKRMLLQNVEQSLKAIYPSFQRNLNQQMRDYVRSQQEDNYLELIDKQQVQHKAFGEIKTCEGRTIIAKSRTGEKVSEALILHFDGDSSYPVTDIQSNESRLLKNGDKYAPKFTDDANKQITFQTKTRFHIDLNPSITMQSAKQIVMTPVTGRDYTRKELVSGGDYSFSVSGNIVSDEPGIYPANKVKQFLEIMNYNGLIKVNSFFFNNMNVEKIIIKDFNLGKQEYLNIQPYSFSCVGVEPNDAIKVTQDTIQVINKELALSPIDNWYSALLKDKLMQFAINSTESVVTNATTSALSLGLDAATGWNDN